MSPARRVVARERMVTVASRPGGRVPSVSTLPIGERIGPRNVRTPQSTVLGNTQSGRPAGKCHREQTADGGTGLRSGPAQVRVKRCGKSAPAPGATRAARQTPSGARPRRGRAARPQTPPGRPLEPAGNRRPRGMAATDGSPEPSGQNPAYRPTHHRLLTCGIAGFRTVRIRRVVSVVDLRVHSACV